MTRPPPLALAAAMLFSFLALCSASCTDAGCVAEQAAYTWAYSKLGWLAGMPPHCHDDGIPDEEPGIEPEALAHSPADVCSTPYDGPDPCVACVRSKCCAEIVACVAEYTCTCRLARKDPRVNWPAEATCDATSDVTDAAEACLSGHCADACQ